MTALTARPSLTATLLGALTVTRDGRDTPIPASCASLLGFLLLRRGRVLSRGELVRAVAAPGDVVVAEDVARRRLNTALWRLRRALEPDGRARATVVVAGRGSLAISPDCEVWVDAEEFERACRPRIALGVDRWSPRDADAVRVAVDSYAGDLLAGCDDEWVLAERARLATLHLAALARMALWHRRQGDLDGVVRFADRVLAREPLREDVHRLLIGAYAAAGHRDAAARQFERCRALLADELGVDPMPETLAALARAARAGTPITGERISGELITGERISGVGADGTDIGEAVRARGIDVGAVIRDLEAARAELARLGRLVDRSLDSLRANRF